MTKEEIITEMSTSLEATIKECLKHPELLQQFRRLRSKPERLTVRGRQRDAEKEAKEFFDFIRDYIWQPVFYPSVTP